MVAPRTFSPRSSASIPAAPFHPHLGQGLRRGLPPVPRVSAPVQQPGGHVVQRRQARDQEELLEHEADPAAMLYAGLFLLAGTALVGLTYGLVASSLPPSSSSPSPSDKNELAKLRAACKQKSPDPGTIAACKQAFPAGAKAASQTQRQQALHSLLLFSLAGLAADAARLGLRVDSELEAAETTGGPNLLEQMVSNLVGNAVRYNQPGGWIRVRTGTNTSAVFVQVRNSGPVVPVDVVPSLFEPFRRVAGRGSARTGARDGAGLGLSIVQSVANAHRASVSARSQPAGGLNVLVVLPRTCPGGPAALP